MAAGPFIPAWFVKPLPSVAPRGDVIRVANADKLLAAVDRGGALSDVTDVIRHVPRVGRVGLGAWEL